jgi:RpiB/LacA/LacB family sugar-phosphate isomerase
MKIGIGADHAGSDLKQLIQKMLKDLGHDVTDYGTKTGSIVSVDYPDFAKNVSMDVSTSKIDAGILVCGTGIGMSISANKIAGIRAAVLTDEFSARMAKAHNNINVACIGSRVVDSSKAIDLIKIWLETPFEEGRHKSRLEKIAQLEFLNREP